MKRARIVLAGPIVAALFATVGTLVPTTASAQFGETGMRNTYLDVCTGCWYLDWPYSHCNCRPEPE